MTYNSEMSKILSQQYVSVCTKPFKDIEDENFKKALFENVNSEANLCDIYIDYDFIEKTLKQLLSKSGPGPDGVPPHCLKYGGLFIINAVAEIARDSRYGVYSRHPKTCLGNSNLERCG